MAAVVPQANDAFRSTDLVENSILIVVEEDGIFDLNYLVRLFNTLNGSVKMALISEKTPSTAIPNNRNGSSSNQMIG